LRDVADLDLLRLEIETCQVMAAPSRFVRVNSPGHHHGPLVVVAGCAAGAVAAVHADLEDALARNVLDFVAAAPAWADTARLPPWIGAMAAMVDVDPATLAGGPAWRLPNGLAYAHEASFVDDASEAGAAMLARFQANGMPPALFDAGYVDVDELWAPWCAAMVGDEVAALCCTARLGERGAEAGLYTFPPFRGQGFGAAVTAAWSRLPALADKTLFYSTQFTNTSSIAVTRRLALRRIGASVGIG
jgi:GNAT superfamily N-acetyltransferase